jgi:predicted AAA+ superfamily ATPase
MLGIKAYTDIFKHPKAGVSFEGFALEELIKYYAVDKDACYFWASHNHAELDLLILKDGQKMGFEFKLSDTPKITPSMKIAQETLELETLEVIYPGNKIYPLSGNIHAIPLTQKTMKI